MARHTHTDFKTKMSIHRLIGQQIKLRVSFLQAIERFARNHIEAQR